MNSQKQYERIQSYIRNIVQTGVNAFLAAEKALQEGLNDDRTAGGDGRGQLEYSSTIAAVKSSMRAEAASCRRSKILERSSLVERL